MLQLVLPDVSIINCQVERNIFSIISNNIYFSKLDWPFGMEPLKNEKVLNIAKKHGKTPAQVLLRHLIQREIIVIPKSVHENRMRENFEVILF